MGCKFEEKKKMDTDDLHEAPLEFDLVENSIQFFDKNAFDQAHGVYFSEVDSKGKVTSDKVHLVALSRLLYALEYASRFDSKYEKQALEASDFFIKNFMSKDTLGTYFFETVEINGEPTMPDNLGIWQQSYGLGGLAVIHRLKKDKATLKLLHDAFEGYRAHFHDARSKGFVGSYAMDEGIQHDDKTLQSILYPMSAALFYMWEQDLENRAKYEPFLKENIALLLEYGWNAKLGWVNLKFDREWRLCGKENNVEPCFNVVPGHNFQLGWVLLQSSTFPFLNPDVQMQCKKLGTAVIENTMKKPIWDGSVSNGFYSEVNPATGKILSKRKTWWQHTEAITALSFMKVSFPNEFKSLLNFFRDNFVDFKGGNEFFFLTEDNSPILTEPKGSMGKSSYHVTEMVLYINQNK
ncbi:AGE family epimerase/isomerase [Flagellimonas sp. CMM7]|uniref:AGE family epimerase/isomerase n=2 Tax=Flagellimonas sp. CMM7 TaxID=2654676 RepID=UPI0013D4A871|nr:AGE family epimerase/isomerase [Flagellimonas sp. CMM7]